MNIIPEKTIKIKFSIETVTAHFGRVWPTRVVSTKQSIGDKYINAKAAELHSDEIVEEKKSLEEGTVKELKVLAADLGIELPNRVSKADIINLIEDAEHEYADESEDDETADEESESEDE